MFENKTKKIFAGSNFLAREKKSLMFSRRGQFFLVAAIIVVALVISLTAGINIANVGADESGFYDLGSEIKDETLRVLDWGTVRDENINLRAQEFLVEYADYVAQEQVIFIYGDESALEAIYFNSETSLGSIGVEGSSVQVEDLVGRIATVTDEGNSVLVGINEIQYRFPKNEGNKFYFVIVKEREDERFVARG